MKKQTLYLFLALFTVTVWGTTFVSTKILLQFLTPLQIMLLRYLIAYAALWLIYPRRHATEGPRQELLFIGAALCGITAYFLAENYALAFTQASNVSLLVCAAPIFTSLAAHLFTQDEKFTRGALYGFLAAMTGIALVVFNGHFVLHLSPAGDLLALAAALSWAFYGTLLRKIHSRYPPVYVTRRIFFYALLTMLPCMLLIDGGRGFAPSLLTRPAVWGNLLFLGVVASSLCYVLWNYVITYMGAVRANNFVYLNPMATMVVSVLVLGERISPLMLAGAALILLGVMLADGTLLRRTSKQA